ncbi:prolipoprotein diacylglyceryl transferase [Saccharicrinis fermentans]|uniref:Phosphatidylglycerol--prolipoprotein diacylglyceryl transferase n=1 Tax=Saccharicrinis fermentans DSM 9555 = JCM 21142 TaxID=869213 RepID=W7YFX4_9BACT|nr:prolipoprotein diacylglyceryl transferase [Saccharicrinis fermentans]GAF03351.1 prolipoprotein diacylglyceryl transferase [Saccharicrinis fermentans DSM 9555 = JCM 21142]
MILDFVTWTVKPEIFSWGPISVRYYGLFFAIAFMLGYQLMEKMFKWEKIPLPWLEKLFMYVVIATIVGARLGHVFFYGWDYYSQHLDEILMVWKGGLASHGGALGIVIAIIIYSKKVTKKSPIWTLDRVVIPTALAAFFIRMGNLMNSEIYGHATDVPWAFRFVGNFHQWLGGAEPVFTQPSHPTQIYEALTYLALFGVIMWMYWKTDAKDRTGLIFGVFLIGTFLSRFFVEFVKNDQESFEADMLLNMGQWLSIPFVLAGIYFVVKAKKSSCG